MENVHARDGSGDSFEQRLRRLTKKRQQLIRPIQEHPRDYVLLPIRDLAGKTGNRSRNRAANCPRPGVRQLS